VAIYASQKKYQEAATILAKTVQIQERKFGRDDLDRLQYVFDLAAIYFVNEKFDKAEPLAVEVVEGRRRTLGPGHKDTVTSMLLLGNIYDKRQKLQPGLTLMNTAYESSRRALGDNDALTLNVKFMMQAFDLKVRNATGDRAAARAEILENAAKSVDRMTASSLPEMIRPRRQPLTIAVNQRKPQEAEAPLLEVIEAARRAGQEELNLTAILAGVYALQKKWTWPRQP
jgi:hypothetical protein